MLADLHKYLQAFPEVVQIPEASGSILTCHMILPAVDAEPHSITIDFRTGFCRFDLSRLVERKSRAFFFFGHETFAHGGNVICDETRTTE